MLKLSVLVICYNQERKIAQTIDSILSQEHQYEYEIIVCDDCSKDSTPDIIKKFHDKFPDIVKPILRQKNLGILKNFIDGITHCKGEYIMFCAGDDFYLPGKIKNQIDFLEHNLSVGLVHSDIKCLDEDNRYIKILYGPKSVSFKSLLRSNNIKAPTIAVRTSEIIRYIKEVNPYGKDWLMEDKPMVIWFSIESQIQYLPGEYVAYRVLNGSLSHPTSRKKYIEFMNSSYDICKFFQRRYPNLISKSFIVNNHINNMFNRLYGADRDYRNFCLKILDEENKMERIKGYHIKKLRAKFILFNIFWNLYSKIKFRFFV